MSAADATPIPGIHHVTAIDSDPPRPAIERSLVPLDTAVRAASAVGAAS